MNTNRRVWYLHEGGKCGKMRMRIQESKVYRPALREQCRAGMVLLVPHNTDGVCDTPECIIPSRGQKYKGEVSEQTRSKALEIDRGVEVWTHTAAPLLISR